MSPNTRCLLLILLRLRASWIIFHTTQLTPRVWVMSRISPRIIVFYRAVVLGPRHARVTRIRLSGKLSTRLMTLRIRWLTTRKMSRLMSSAPRRSIINLMCRLIPTGARSILIIAVIIKYRPILTVLLEQLQ